MGSEANEVCDEVGDDAGVESYGAMIMEQVEAFCIAEGSGQLQGFVRPTSPLNLSVELEDFGEKPGDVVRLVHGVLGYGENYLE